ncbi:FmdB family transcriptional regulator [Microbacterium sp. LRZ72]|uniref:FmdB family zinc ribbon protein n=1 Tax=Microbacterium sp. LRZ72 TaxID=2942481 RepID=UPI0029BCF746|nr:FmdB family zinc ribbon protein [Microbacterium sp. LRZ72]MDX2375910.1 FmdB family transcriptional regulator [Microbacterium sp. LRZ72]
MPTYAYACKSCSHRFETVQSFTDPTLTECPECAGTLRKEYGSIGVTFNGSGFYRTDSRAGEGKSGSTGSSSAKKSESGGSSSESGTKTESGGSSSTSSSSATKTAAPAAS